MEYTLLTLVEEKDLALQILEFLKTNGVDSYVDVATNYDSDQWGVYIDESKASLSQDLLNSFYEQEYEQGYNQTDYAATPQAEDSSNHSNYYSSSESGSSSKWLYTLIVALVIGGIRFYIKHHNDEQHYQNTVDLLDMVHQKSYYDRGNNYTIKMTDFDKNNDDTQEQVLETPKKRNVTLDDIRLFVDKESKKMPQKISDELELTKISLKGAKLCVDVKHNNEFDLRDMNKETLNALKRLLAKDAYDSYSINKMTFGDDFFEQLVTLGVSFEYRFFAKGSNVAETTINIPASYIVKTRESV